MSYNPGLSALAVVLIAIIAAGCITDNSPAPADVPAMIPATVTHMGTVTPVPTTPGCAYPPLNPWTGVPESYSSPLWKKPASLPAPGSNVSYADLVGTPSLNWIEYTFTTQTQDSSQSGGSMRTEISKENYHGKPAVHKKYTYIIHTSGLPPAMDDTSIYDTYYDNDNNVLYKHQQVVRNGVTLEDSEIPVDSTNSTPDCSEWIWALKYTYLGIDPITIPAGTFPEALKYTTITPDDNPDSEIVSGTFWFVPDVPVEVKRILINRERGSLFTMELTGWG
jgi:hypothetical protein